MIINYPKIEKHKVSHFTFIKMMIGLFLEDISFPLSYNQYLANKYDFLHSLTEEEFNIITEIYFKKCCFYCLFADLYLVAFCGKINFKEYEKVFFENIKNALLDYKKMDVVLAEKKADEYIKDIKRLKINKSFDSEEKIPIKLRGIFYTEIACGDIDKMDDIDRLIEIIRDYSLKLICKYYKKTIFLDKIKNSNE